jgi:DNA (cytosine-5)-methyltransferase 1
MPTLEATNPKQIIAHTDTVRDVSPTITSNYGKQLDSSDTALGPNVAYAIQDSRPIEKAQNGRGWNADGTAYTIDTQGNQGVASTSTVRRLTPVECERLQGFPDNFTAIPWRKKDADQCPDGPRYKALGNSMAVPVMRWIGERINLIDDYLSII